MKTEFMTVEAIIADEKRCPLSIDVIPNYMGINLCSVEGVSWTRQDDDQLVSLTIHFIPAPQAPLRQKPECSCGGRVIAGAYVHAERCNRKRPATGAKSPPRRKRTLHDW